MKKVILSVILVLMLIFSAFTVTVSAVPTDTENTEKISIKTRITLSITFFILKFLPIIPD